MDKLLFPEKLIADESTRAGRTLAAGDIRVTVIGYTDDVTIRFKALLDNRFNSTNSTRPRPDQKRNWLRVPLDEATHVFVEVPNPSGNYPDKVGTFYTRTGKWFADKNIAPDLSDTAIIAANWLNGNVTDELTDDLDFRVEQNCGVCGHVLHDSEEIERGIDSDCYQQLQSRHKHKQLRFPAKRESSPFMVNKILIEIDTLSTDDQKGILNELQLKLN
jgi:hypothetical protein